MALCNHPKGVEVVEVSVFADDVLYRAGISPTLTPAEALNRIQQAVDSVPMPASTDAPEGGPRRTDLFLADGDQREAKRREQTGFATATYPKRVPKKVSQ